MILGRLALGEPEAITRPSLMYMNLQVDGAAMKIIRCRPIDLGDTRRNDGNEK